MRHALHSLLAVDYPLLVGTVVALAVVLVASLVFVRWAGKDWSPVTVAIALTLPPFAVAALDGHTASETLLALVLFYGAVGAIQGRTVRQ